MTAPLPEPVPDPTLASEQAAAQRAQSGGWMTVRNCSTCKRADRYLQDPECVMCRGFANWVASPDATGAPPPDDRLALEFWEREFERRDVLSVARVCVGKPDEDRELASEMAGHGRRADAALVEWRKRWGGGK